MTIVLSSDEVGSRGLGTDADNRIQELGQSSWFRVKTIGDVVARTNQILAGHREWLNLLSQRAGVSIMEEHQMLLPIYLTPL